MRKRADKRANILKQQAAIEKRGGKLHPTTAKALAAAQAKLAPAGPAATTNPGSSTHTTNGTTPSQLGHGNLIPDTTTSPEHIDLARRRTDNLEKIAAKRKLDPHEQSIYDNARRVRDRNAPGQSEAGSRPQDTAPEGSQPPHSPENPPSEASGITKRPLGEAPAPAADGRVLKPSSPDPEGNSRATDTTPNHPGAATEAPTGTNPQTAGRPAEGITPDQAQATAVKPDARPADTNRPPAPTTAGTPPAATVDGSQPPSSSALVAADAARRLGNNVPGDAQQQKVAGEQVTLASPAAEERIAQQKEFPQSNAIPIAIGDGTRASQSRQEPHSVPADTRSIEERRAENTDLLARRPRRSSPFSNKVSITVRGLFGEVLRKVATLCDHAYDDGKAPPVAFNDVWTRTNWMQSAHAAA